MSSHGDGSDSEVDIYGDLPQVQNHEETLVKLEEAKKQLEDEVENLKKQLDTLVKKNSVLESKCKALSKNISSLFKTASAEIERKDRMILQLRKEKDNIVFRRNRNDSMKRNYTTNENDQQVGGENTAVEPLHEEPQHTCITMESAYENESDKIDSQSKYQRNIPACNDGLAVQEYDTIFNRRQRQKYKQEMADKSEIKNKNSEYVKGIACTSDKSDLVPSKTKSSEGIISKTNIKDTLRSDSSFKEYDTETHMDETQTLEDTSHETVPSKATSASERWGSYRIHETRVSQTLEHLTSTSKPQSKLKTLAKHQLTNEKSTSDCTSPQNTKSMISSRYNDHERELKCNNNNESKINFQASNDEVISEKANSTVLNTNTNIFQFKLSEHCDFKRQRKCRIKHLSSATKEGLKIVVDSKSESSEDYRGFLPNEVVDAIALKENVSVNKTSDKCSVNDSDVSNGNVSDRSTNSKSKTKIHIQKAGTVIENLENKFEVDKVSYVSDRNSKENSAGKTDKLLDPVISINIDKNREQVLYHKNGKEKASYCMREQKEANCNIGNEMHNVKDKSKPKETGDNTKSEDISIHSHDDMKNTSQKRTSESRISRHHQFLKRNQERHEISRHYKNYHKWYGFPQMTDKERNRRLVRMDKRDESFKSWHQSIKDDREKFSTHKNIFKGRYQNYATETWNVKERKQSSVLREPNAEMMKEISKKLRLSKKISAQDEINRNISDNKYNRTETRTECMNTCELCKLKCCECKTEVKGLIDLQKHKQDDSTRNDTSVYKGSLHAQQQKNQKEAVEGPYRDTENCKIHPEAKKEIKKSPVPSFNVKRKPRSFRLEDSRVVSINISPPKSVDIVSSKDNEVCKDGEHVSQYSETVDGVYHNMIKMPETGTVANNKDLRMKTEGHFSNNVNSKTDFNFRKRYADVFSQETCYTSDEDDFFRCSSSYESDQCSDESWHPGTRQKRKIGKSKKMKTKRLRTF